MGCCDLRQRELRTLQRETSGADYVRALRRLQAERQIAGDHDSWWAVASSGDATSDTTLRAVLTEHARDGNELWQKVLFLLFWGGLGKLLRIKSRLDPDPFELWCEVEWAFTRVISRIDLTSRTEGLGQKIFNDVAHDVSDAYRRQRALDAPLLSLDAVEAGDLPEDGNLDHALTELEIDLGWKRDRLRRLRNECMLTDADYVLLIGTEIYGHSVSAAARDAGMSYDVAKKRRQRALVRVREYFEFHKKVDSECPRVPQQNPLEG